MLQGNDAYMHQFKRDTYAEAFDSFLEKYSPLFQEIESAYQEADDKENLIKELADTFAASAKEDYEAQKKAKRSSYLIDNNTMMVVYILPALNAFEGTFQEAMVPKLVDEYNATFTQYKIKAGTFDDINGGFKRKLCYVTTAVCLSLGKSEDCSEIKILKDYRDGFLLDESDGQTLIDEYYDIAPTIVNRINKKDNAHEIYKQIYQNYIEPCISLIGENRMHDCKELYVSMMRNLQQEFMVSHVS